MTAIPFDIPSPQIPFVVMTGEAAGRPLRVLFDSGDAAPYVVLLGAAHGGELAKPTGEPTHTTAAVAGGAPASFTPALLPSFHLGPVRLTGVRAALSPSVDLVGGFLPGGLDAVVGYEFVAGRVVAVDYDARRIDFAAEPGRGRPVAMTITPAKHLTVVDATINGKGPFHLALDTGAAGTLLSPDAAARAGVQTGAAVQVGGAGGKASQARVAKADLAVGEHRWPAATLYVADLLGPISAEAGMPIDGVLGAPLFAHGRLVLDYAGQRVWISEGAKARP